MRDRNMSAILGDEMGLGKTLHSIVFLSSLKLDRQLKGMFRRWSPKLRVLLVHGSGSFLLLQK